MSTDLIHHASQYLASTNRSDSLMRQTSVNLGLLPQAFREALIADLSAEYGAEQMHGWLNEDSVIHLGAKLNGSVLRDAVVVCTRQMRQHDYYPEQVLVAIKSAVREAAIGLLADSTVNDLICEAGQSCIDAYFDSQSPAEANPPAQQGVRLPRNAKVPDFNHLSPSPERHL